MTLTGNIRKFFGWIYRKIYGEDFAVTEMRYRMLKKKRQEKQR